MRPPAVRGAVAATAFTVAGALVLTGCSGSSRSSGSGAADKSSSSSSTPDGPTAVGSPSAGLTPAQLKAALPKAGELPKGWKVDSTGTLTGNMTLKDNDSVTPASCTAASQVQQNFNFVAPAGAHDSIDFVSGGQSFIGATVYSFATPYPSAAFTAIRAAVAKCPSYRETEDDGSSVSDQVRLIDVPSVGDESLGLEVTSTYQGVALDLVIVLARSGSTLVAVEDAGAGAPASASRAEQLVRTTLARLPA